MNPTKIVGAGLVDSRGNREDHSKNSRGKKSKLHSIVSRIGLYDWIHKFTSFGCMRF